MLDIVLQRSKDYNAFISMPKWFRFRFISHRTQDVYC